MRSLIAWTRTGQIIATLDNAVAWNENGEVIGLIDFAAHEDAGGKMRDIWDVSLLDTPIPPAVAKKQLGREPKDRERVDLPKDHPFRVEHETVAGSGTWPEWLGTGAYAFDVEVKNGLVTALIHRESGYRRDRAAIEAAIADRVAQAGGKPADIRDLVGGPNRPLLLDEAGKTRPRAAKSPPLSLPVVAARKG